MHRLLQDYNKKDMILYEKKDFKNELEDISFPEKIEIEEDLQIEDIVSIAEQIRNTVKNLDEYNPEKFYMDTPNFGVTDIETAKLTERTTDLTKHKVPEYSLQFDYHALKNESPIYNHYEDEELDKILHNVEKLRRTSDLPFDQLYHKEKSLIDAVSKAAKAENQVKKEIEEMEKKFNQQLETMYNVKDEDLKLLFEHQEQIAQAKSGNSADALFESDHDSSAKTKTPLEDLLDNISEGYFKKVKKFLQDKAAERNKGYCFVTFSNIDEAKMCLLSSKEIFVENHRLKVELKDELDHKDFDPVYLLEQTKLDAKMLDKKEQLAEAKKKLAEFEDNFEQNMPKTYNLNRMKQAAVDAIENNILYDRNEFPRTNIENKRVKEKLKEFEQNTGIDVSPLYEDSNTESERVRRHKKAFNTYKSYSFLKAGLDKTSLEKKLTANYSAENNNQYKFPSSDKIAKVFISDDYKLRLMKQGQENTEPGRKFGYSYKKFIEDYIGKERIGAQGAAQINQISLNDDRKIYSFNDEMRVRYPYEMLSVVPNLEKLAKEQSDYALSRNRHAKELINPERAAEKQRVYKRLMSGEDEIKYGPEIPDNIFVEGNINRRTKKLIKDSSTIDPKTKRVKAGPQNIRKRLKDETMDHNLDYAVNTLMRMEKEQYPDEDKDQQQDSQEQEQVKVDEKWEPTDKPEDQKEIEQQHKEKIYSNYLDDLDYQALKEGQDAKYNINRSKFTDEYLQSLAKSKDIEPTKKRNKNQLKYSNKYIEELNYRRKKFISNRMWKEHHETNEKLSQKEGENYSHLSFREKFIIDYKKHHGEYEKEIKDPLFDKNKQKRENQEFLYRKEYSAKHPEVKDIHDAEESLKFKMVKASDRFNDRTNEFIKSEITNHRFSDYEKQYEFEDSVKEGSIALGIETREQNLPQNDAEKDLGQIANSETEESNIYDLYRNQNKVENIVDQEAESIKQREANFLKAVYKDINATSLSENRTFQDYENYKRAIQKEEPFDDETEQSSESEKAMSKREWLAKIWSGRLSAQDFEDTMVENKHTTNEMGHESHAYSIRNIPKVGRKDFISLEDQQRLANESAERLRRTLIENKQMNEEQSYKFIEDLKGHLEEVLEYRNSPTFKLIGDTITDIMLSLEQGEFVREYYFDPSQGVSLEEHIRSIKTRPGIEVQTRLDKDGFTIIKKIIKNHYKYNLDTLLANTPQQLEFELQETIDKCVRDEMSIRNVDKLDEETLADIMNKQKESNSPTQQKLDKLLEFSQDIVENADQFRDEILEQIRYKIKKFHMFYKVNEEDIIKKRLPETVIMERLRKEYERAILDREQALKTSDDNMNYLNKLKNQNKRKYYEVIDEDNHDVLSKEDYKKLKEEIRAKKQAKSMLLKQGYPDLKNYVYL